MAEHPMTQHIYNSSIQCSRESLSSCVGNLSLRNSNIKQISLGDPHSPHWMFCCIFNKWKMHQSIVYLCLYSPPKEYFYLFSHLRQLITAVVHVYLCPHQLLASPSQWEKTKIVGSWIGWLRNTNTPFRRSMLSLTGVRIPQLG